MLLELPDQHSVRRYYAEAQRQRTAGQLPGEVRDVVPAARTILLDERQRTDRRTWAPAPPDPRAALTRTAQLLRMDVFRSDPADDGLIVAGLRGTTARVVADRANLASHAGQTALVTLCGQLAMLGIHIDLDIVDVPLVRAQPPLSGDRLHSALTAHLSDLMPGGNVPTGSPDVTFALGATRPPPAQTSESSVPAAGRG